MALSPRGLTSLWARAILQIDGPAQFRSSTAFYPPLPFVLALFVQPFTGAMAVPGPFLIAAALGAGLLLVWYVNLRDTAGFSRAASLGCVALLALNPFFLRAVAEGGEALLTLLGTWVFARGIVNLRLTGNAPDMMKVAVGMLVVSLSSSYGLMICLGSLPFMIVAARPSMLLASPTGYLFAMFYPIVAGIGSLMVVAAIFDSQLMPLLVEGVAPVALRDHLWVLAGLVPVALAATLSNLRALQYFLPLMAINGAVVGAYVLNLGFHVESDLIIAAAPLLAVVVVALRFWPPSALRAPAVLAVLLLGLVLSAQSLRMAPPGESRDWALAVTGTRSPARDATAELAAVLQGKSGIMVDAERNPTIITALRGVKQLAVAGQVVYDWALEGGVPRAAYILIPAAGTEGATRDRILRRFPQLEQDRLAGYSEVFRNAAWRLFEPIRV